jgi:iron complex transport system permease protein
MENFRLKKRRYVLLLSIGLLVFLIPIAASSGALHISIHDLWNESASMQREIFFNIRLPRVILSILLGGSLAWSGAMIQGLFRNPIVDPGLAGITAGASLFAGIAIVFGQYIPFLSSIWNTVIFSFAGGMMAGLLILSLSRYQGKTEVYSLLLIGIAINAVCFSAIGLLSYVANDSQLRNLSYWNLGSLGGASWTSLSRFGFLLFLPVLTGPFLYRKLNAFTLGEREAFHLGVSVEGLKILILFLIGISVGASVSLTGNISFIGIVIPHIVRILIGQDYKYLLPISYLLGGCLLLFSDTICRTVIAPTEIPVGIITAIIGAPFFLYLLRSQRKVPS